MRTAGAWLVGALCAYELAALTTQRTPTISKLSWEVRHHPAGAVAIWAALGLLSWHLLVDNDA